MRNTTHVLPGLADTPAATERTHTSERRDALKKMAVVALSALALGRPDPSEGARERPQRTPASTPGRHFAIPISLLEEHAELYSALEAAGRMQGETGPAARRLVALRGPHMAKEQRLAYPLLRLLPLLTKGEAEPWMADLVPLADQLRSELPRLKEEHIVIKQAAQELHDAGWADGRPEYAMLAQRLKHHIDMEEEILFPAALVTAEYVRGRLTHSPGATR